LSYLLELLSEAQPALGDWTECLENFLGIGILVRTQVER
jgi:hypothetical protein